VPADIVAPEWAVCNINARRRMGEKIMASLKFDKEIIGLPVIDLYNDSISQEELWKL
jgi:negative regulator of replication initiation